MEKIKQTQILGLILALGIVLAGTVVVFIQTPKSTNGVPYYDIKNFRSYQEFTSFLRDGIQNYDTYRYQGRSTQPVFFTDGTTKQFEQNSDMSGGKSIDFSETNIQIEGVDEPDIVKTDGTYLYVVSNNYVFIIKAYPTTDIQILAKITIDSNQTIRNIFISKNKLIIFTESYLYPILKEGYTINPIETDKSPISSVYMPWYSSPDTYVKLYSIEDKARPVLTKEIIIGGSFTNARLIEDYVYVITTQYSYSFDTYSETNPIIPRILINGNPVVVPLSDIYYVDTQEKSNTITNIISVNVHNDDEQIHQKVFLIGSSQTIFVSQNNIYIASSSWYYDYTKLQQLVETLVTPLLSDTVKSQLELVQKLDLEEYQKTQIIQWILQKNVQTISEEQKNEIITKIVTETERTIIHRIHISKGDITYEAQGSIPGYVQNQFSFNEHNGYLQISTTIYGNTLSYILETIESRNNIYILDMNLTIVGRVENIAPGETIYATRFIGDKCYLVTFRQIDPFFVVDLANPEKPVILGELKIPGYSTYLHPYDDHHIIGIGRQGSSVKLSLFDITDMNNPLELTNYTTPTLEWSDSSALYEHKAFLFDKEKNLLVIPVGNYYNQEAYVFTISPDQGIVFRGNISHAPKKTLSDPENIYYYDYGYSIQRTLYIEDVLYTLSTNMVKMHDLTTLSELNTVSLVEQ
ncbi:MAG: beta-propeller domain-containing protein [Candidatus Thermoplasmatota archaeon]